MLRKLETGQRRSEGGFTYVEALLSVVFLATALLGHASSTITEHQMAEVGQARSEAVYTARQFVERIRADEDFAGLLSRITALQLQEATSTGVTLKDGRPAYAPSAYCPDFASPSGLDSLCVRVEVPVQGKDTPVLREDVVLPAFDLPGDLNGDGLIDGDSRNADYRALPVALFFGWSASGKAPAEFRVATWLRGRR